MNQMPTSPNREAAPTRRKAVLWSTAALAAVAGVGAGWWSLGRQSADAGAESLWAQRFDTPEGQPLEWSAVRGNGPLLVNFWATWCPPCVAELPLLDQFGREHAAKGWRVLGLAVDQPSSVRKFLSTRHVAFPVGMAGLQGTDLSRSLGNQQGSLPFTVVLAANGRVLHRKIGQVTEAELKSWAS